MKGRSLLCSLVASALAFAPMSLCGCRPTDFFTEVVISPFATTVDESNENQTIVNSPDASKTSNDLASLSWNKKAKKSKQVENLVTYSKKPTTTLNTHHSVYDTSPRYKGIKSSDAVQLEFGNPAKLKKKKGTKAADSNESSSSKNRGTKGRQSTTTKTNSGSSATGTNKSKSKTTGKSKGKSGKKSGGYNGKMNIYDPNNALSDPPKADSIAAIGQAAVLVQAIGGKNSLVAMDKSTYSTKQSKGAASFSQVFSDKLADGFSSKALLWSGDGTTPTSLTSAEKLVSACGKNGVIVYDQDQVDPDSGWFDKKQKRVLHDANITFVPVSFASTSAIKDAATVVGKVLSKQSRASEYCEALDTVISTAKAAVKDTSNKTYTAIATDFVTGLRYTGRLLSTEDGLLFTRLDGTSGLANSATNAGLVLKDYNSLSDTKSSYAVLWGIRYGANYSPSYFSKDNYTSNCANDIQLNSGNTTTSGSAWPGHGLASDEFPYLIVSASGNLTATEVKSRVIAEINSYSTDGTITPYSALPGNAVGKEPNRAVSTIGSSGDSSKDNLLYGNENLVRRSVRANPSGLLGSWTTGSVESVLETAWLARIYSGTPNDEYEPIDDLSKTDLRNAVLDFYQTAYGYNARSVYGKVVTDEGED